MRLRWVVNNKGQNGEKRCATKENKTKQQQQQQQQKLRSNCQSVITKRHS